MARQNEKFDFLIFHDSRELAPSFDFLRIHPVQKTAGIHSRRLEDFFRFIRVDDPDACVILHLHGKKRFVADFCAGLDHRGDAVGNALHGADLAGFIHRFKQICLKNRQ